MNALEEIVLQQYGLSLDGVHGPHHWRRVLTNGLALAERTPTADRIVVEAFAWLHDAKRIDEGRDIGHGERAAEFARTLHGSGQLVIEASQLLVLMEACAGHEHGRVSADPTIGCCWDADRLDLSRLHRRPIARLLSTSAALDPTLQRIAWDAGAHFK